MEKFMRKYIAGVVSVLFIVALSACQPADSETKTISVDISELTENLLIREDSQSSSANRSQAQSSSADATSDAQDAVATLLIAPLTFTNHGKKYSVDDFDEDTENDLENDAVNSVDFLQFVQLSSRISTVEIEVPTISDGWQLIAVATNVTIEDVEEFKSDSNDGSMKYIGFTEDSFTSADDLSSSDSTLTLKRYCDQDADYRPKGCATFDGDGDAIVTAAVEIHGVSVNDEAQTHATESFPWIVRESPDAGEGEISASNAESHLKDILEAFIGTPEKVTVTATHQLSISKSTACQGLDDGDATSDFDDECGFQTYTRYID